MKGIMNIRAKRVSFILKREQYEYIKARADRERDSISAILNDIIDDYMINNGDTGKGI